MEGFEVRYARSGGIDIAYQEFGRPDGPRVVYVPGFVSHLDLNWDAAPFGNILRSLAASCRVVTFDKRGTGLSERDFGFGSIAERSDDVRAVLDAVGWDRAHLVGLSEGGPMSMLLAATDPDRVAGLALCGTGARFVPAPGYPYGFAGDVDGLVDWIERNWGTGAVLSAGFWARCDLAPPGFVARFERSSCTPRTAALIMRRNCEIDVRDLLPTITVPTLVLHATGDRIVERGIAHHVTDAIPGARLFEIEGDFHGSWDARDYAPMLEELGTWITGRREPVAPERALATVLFTDIVGSTAQAAAAGDRAWRAILDGHDRVCDRVVTEYAGRVVKHTGDGLLATFGSPARAVLCAQALRSALAATDVTIRAGVHTGEVELRGDDIGGIAVHIGARVAELADAGEVLVSRTVRDLTAGSELAFAERGVHPLKGVPEPWQLYAAAG